MKKTEKIVLQSIPEDYYAKFVGSGMNSNCYLTSKGDLYKEFFRKRDDYGYLKTLSESFDSKHIAFPNSFVFLEDDLNGLVGYVRDYVDGDTFEKLPYDVDMNQFIIALNDFEKDLYQNTRYGLEYRDMHAKNMLYKNGLITAIDTESFNYSYEDGKQLLIESLYEMYYTICCEMLQCNNVEDQNALDIIKRSSKVGYCEYLRTSQMLEKLIEYLQNTNNCDIKTYGDLKNKLVLRR